MTNSAGNNLSNEKIQQLLSAVGSRNSGQTPDIDAQDYDWMKPHYFNEKQLGKLDTFTNNLSEAIAEKITDFYKSDCKATTDPAEQYFARDYFEQASNEENSCYYSTFGDDQDNLFGVIEIPAPTAMAWTRQLLGGADEGEEESNELSMLAESLLADIASFLTDTFSNASSIQPLQTLAPVIKNLDSVEINDTRQLCKITLKINKEDTGDNSEISFILLSDMLAPFVGKTGAAAQTATTQEISKAMMDHVNKISFDATTQLASCRFSFQEIMDLAPGDVLMFNKNLNQPCDLLIENQSIFAGTPAKHDHNHALVITEVYEKKHL
jgi:flagellar motor switch protein FliM